MDYITVGKMMDAIKPPYVIDVSAGVKRVVIIGCDHNRDTLHPQFKIIEKYFRELKPQASFNEGGQVLFARHYASLNQAITKAGEIGCLKFLSDQAKIKMMNGDMTDSAEFNITLRKVPKDKLLLYYVMERMVIPYLAGAYGNEPFNKFYENNIKDWFVGPGINLSVDQQKFSYFQKIYRLYIGHDFQLSRNSDLELFDYLNPNCEFCQIGRISKMTRDSVLINKIETTLKTRDRIIVTFGHGHAIAIKPAIYQIMAKYR